jgi:hypothetical protein
MVGASDKIKASNALSCAEEKHIIRLPALDPACHDDGVLYGAETKGDATVTSPVQTYLDLRQIKGRGEEAADFLKQQVIQPSWPENA